MARTVVLASSSPRRQDFLARLGVDFVAQAADVDETPLCGEAPIALAKRLAEAKTAAVAATLPEDANVVTVGADTVVALGDTVLGKPADADDATQMLVQLRAKPHQVYSGVSLFDHQTGQTHTRVNTTTVWMRDYTDAEIATYVATGDPLDKAGAYAIQHPEFAPAVRVEGCLSGVVGLPLGDLHDLFTLAGIATRDVVDVCEGRTPFACCRREGATGR